MRKQPAPVPVSIEDLSTRRQEIIRPVLENPREYVLLSIRSLAQRLGTDPATIVRIVRGMGFEKYQTFKTHLHELALARITALDSMQLGMNKGSDVDEHTRGSIQQDFKNLNGLRYTLDLARIAAAAKRMASARYILILGGDLAACLVSYLEYQLHILGLPVFVATSTGSAVHIPRSLGGKDVALAISFRRGLRQTVEGLRQARENGAYCIGVTDTYVSPIARNADEVFLASVETPSFGASYTAPMALLNVLLLACANTRRDRTMKMLRKADEEQRSGYRWYTGETAAIRKPRT